MNNSKKIPNDMRANLQQRAKDLRRNKDAAMIQEQKIPDNKEKEQEHNVPPKMEEIKKVQNKSDQQVEEWDSFVANDSSAEDVIRKKIIDYASQNNVVENDLPLAKGTIVTHKGVKNGQEVATSYEIIEKISSGGFGITYKVILANHISEKFFVLKEFYPKGAGRNPQDKHINFSSNQAVRDAMDEFCKEPQRIRELIFQHYAPNSEKGWKSLNLVIPKTDAFEAFHNLYYVMDFVEGTPLLNLLTNLPNYNSLSLSNRLWIVKELCKAVKNLQSIGCIHQDITPNNIMVNLEGKRVVLIDYGLCTSVVKQGTNASLFKPAGTPGFWDKQNFPFYIEDSNKSKLLHVFSLGAILAYTCLLKNPKNINEEFLYKLDFHEELDEKDNSIKKKNNIIYNKIKDLVSRSIERELNERIQSIEIFEQCLDSIIALNEKSIHIDEDAPISSIDTDDALFTIREEKLRQQDTPVSQPIEIVTSPILETVKEERRQKEEKRKKEETRKKAEAEEQAQQKKRQEEADKKRNEETKRKIIKYVLGLLAGVLIISLVAWGLNEWKQRPILPETKPKVETPVVKAPTSELDADAIISPSPVNENWMDEPLANLEKLNNDQMMAVLERAQQDLDFRHQLEHHCHRDLTILQLDQNGVPFKTTMLQLFMDNELGKEYEVSETEIVDNKLKRIILTKK